MSTVIPIVAILRLRDELGVAVAAQKWKTSRNRARSISELIPAAMGKDTCHAGQPHIDGLFSVGTQSYLKAPAATKAALDGMNRLIRDCREKLGKKKKKKKKG